MILDYLKVGPLDVNCSILVCPNNNEAIVIDPGGNEEDILARIAALDARVKLILITHSHFDHVIAGARIKKETGAPVYLPRKDRGVWRLMGLQFKLAKIEDKKPPRIDRFLKEGEKVSVGSLTLEVIHTPGHSPGGCAFYMRDKNLIFAGDSLYRDSVGNWQVPFGNFEDLVRTLHDKFMTLPDNTRVIPGHGEETTIGREREHNPFLKPGRIEELREAERTRPGTFRMLLAMLLPKFFGLKSTKK